MALPEQIRKQTEAVQELYKQLNGDGTNGEGQNPPTDGGTPPTEPVANSTPTADENAATNNAAQPPSDEHTNGGGKDAEETLTQKYRTLQGMYNAEVPRLHSQNKELSGRLQQMEQLLATISQQNGRSQSQQVEETLITDKDQEEYGESLDVMRRVTREELIPVAQKIAQIDRLLQQLQVNVVPQVNAVVQRQALSAEQQFWSDLTSYAPQWKDINNDPAFQSWLLEVDPLSGITRQTILEDAQNSLDVRRVGNFFKSWLELTGQANVAQNTRRNVSASELERQVAPGKGRNTGNPSGSNAKTYSPDDIKLFFNDVRQGKYKGREAERDRIERDIFAAQRDGRITVNT
jgi:hypothetical protein